MIAASSICPPVTAMTAPGTSCGQEQAPNNPEPAARRDFGHGGAGMGFASEDPPRKSAGSSPPGQTGAAPFEDLELPSQKGAATRDDLARRPSVHVRHVSLDRAVFAIDRQTAEDFNRKRAYETKNSAADMEDGDVPADAAEMLERIIPRGRALYVFLGLVGREFDVLANLKTLSSHRQYLAVCSTAGYALGFPAMAGRSTGELAEEIGIHHSLYLGILHRLCDFYELERPRRKSAAHRARIAESQRAARQAARLRAQEGRAA